MSYPDGTYCSFIENYRGYDILSCGPGTWPYDAQGVVTYTIPDLMGIYSFYPSLARAHEVIDEALGEEVATTITLDAPFSALPGEPFTISGYLTETVSGVPVSVATIRLYINGDPLAQLVTDANGYYAFTTSLEAGIYTLEAVFVP